jgi:acyl carrier protein
MSKLDRLIAELFEDDCGSVPDDEIFREIPGWDSLKHVQLVVGIQFEYGVDLSADEISQLVSKRAVLNILAARGLHEQH